MRRLMLDAVIATAVALTQTTIAHAMPGWPDLTFGQSAGQVVPFDLGSDKSDEARALVVLPDQRLLLAGTVNTPFGDNGIGLARLSANGQPDLQFGRPWYLPAGVEHIAVRDAALQANGRLVVVGFASLSIEQGQSTKAIVCRFMANGAPDLGFAPVDNMLAGTGCRIIAPKDLGILQAVVVQSDGRIALAGSINVFPNNEQAIVARLDSSGNMDAGFDGDGIHILSTQSQGRSLLYDIAQSPDGALVAVGETRISQSLNWNWRVFRLRGQDGALDPGFNGGVAKSIALDLVANGKDGARSVDVLPNGSMLIGGTAGVGGSHRCPTIVRLTSQGSFDPILAGDGIFVDDTQCLEDLNLPAMKIQTDGRIVLAGDYAQEMLIMRVNANGVRDQTFGAGGVFTVDLGFLHGIPGSTEDRGHQLAEQNGRLVIAGSTKPNDVGRSDFAVLGIKK